MAQPKHFGRWNSLCLSLCGFRKARALAKHLQSREGKKNRELPRAKWLLPSSRIADSTHASNSAPLPMPRREASSIKWFDLLQLNGDRSCCYGWENHA